MKMCASIPARAQYAASALAALPADGIAILSMPYALHIVTAAHVNHFVIHAQRLPRAALVLVVALAVELLFVQVLHVCHERRESPRHMLIVPGDNEWKPRQRNSRGMKARRAQIGRVPDVGYRQAEVHVV